ncbi:hypothetical protein MHYP_G00157310 [Metynnis hypsauchen]
MSTESGGSLCERTEGQKKGLCECRSSASKDPVCFAYVVRRANKDLAVVQKGVVIVHYAQRKDADSQRKQRLKSSSAEDDEFDRDRSAIKNRPSSAFTTQLQGRKASIRPSSLTTANSVRPADTFQALQTEDDRPFDDLQSKRVCEWQMENRVLAQGSEKGFWGQLAGTGPGEWGTGSAPSPLLLYFSLQPWKSES